MSGAYFNYPFLPSQEPTKLNELMSSRYFSELRDGRLSTKKLHRSHPSYSRYFRAGFLGVGTDIQNFRPYEEQ
jgi:hypothetical protein